MPAAAPDPCARPRPFLSSAAPAAGDTRTIICFDWDCTLTCKHMYKVLNGGFVRLPPRRPVSGSPRASGLQLGLCSVPLGGSSLPGIRTRLEPPAPRPSGREPAAGRALRRRRAMSTSIRSGALRTAMCPRAWTWTSVRVASVRSTA